MHRDDELIRSITNDVLSVLRRERFFEALDDIMFPATPSSVAQPCDGTHRLAEGILVQRRFHREAIGDAIAVLKSVGGCCECEVLYNVASESRLKAAYWKGQVRKT
jgi:hypothetical protein